jgi:hypothetical protein
VGIAVHVQALVGAERCAFGIVDPRIEFKRRGFAGRCDLDRPVRGDIPRMGKIQVQGRTRHQRRIREARAGIFRRESGNAASLGHRRPDRLQGKIRGTG